MKVLLISPLGAPVNEKTTYAGIEVLVRNYAGELVKRGHQVSVMGHTQSIFPEGVRLLGVDPGPDMNAGEMQSYRLYQRELREHDVIHDFSHLHLACRMNENLPALNIFWHAPALAQYPKSPYNIIALSQWAAREFQRVYRQAARYQQSIALDTTLYKPLPYNRRGNRFLSVGRNDPEKGNLAAIMLCKDAGVPLDVIGARGMHHGNEPLTDYEQEVLDAADGEQIRFLGDLPEGPKIELMQTCKALIYATDHPEVTSHKIQEVLFCGGPVIVPDLGALPEIVTQGIDGFLCRTKQEYLDAVKYVDRLTPEKTWEATVKKFSIEGAVDGYLPLYEAVAKGERW